MDTSGRGSTSPEPDAVDQKARIRADLEHVSSLDGVANWSPEASLLLADPAVKDAPRSVVGRF